MQLEQLQDHIFTLSSDKCFSFGKLKKFSPKIWKVFICVWKSLGSPAFSLELSRGDNSPEVLQTSTTKIKNSNTSSKIFIIRKNLLKSPAIVSHN